MERKEFIKTTCNFCLLGAASLMIPGLVGCSPTQNVFKTVVNNKQIEVPLQLFDKENLQMVRPKGFEFDIAVQKNKDGNFIALLMQCTHADNEVQPSQNGFYCNAHGSQFDANGKVLKGPAALNLKQYKTSINNNNLIISV